MSKNISFRILDEEKFDTIAVMNGGFSIALSMHKGNLNSSKLIPFFPVRPREKPNDFSRKLKDKYDMVRGSNFKEKIAILIKKYESIKNLDSKNLNDEFSCLWEDCVYSPIKEKISEKEFINNSKYRLLGEVNKSKIAKVIDDYLYSEGTMTSTIYDLFSLGYEKVIYFNMKTSKWYYGDLFAHYGRLGVFREAQLRGIERAHTCQVIAEQSKRAHFYGDDGSNIDHIIKYFNKYSPLNNSVSC